MRRPRTEDLERLRGARRPAARRRPQLAFANREIWRTRLSRRTRRFRWRRTSRLFPGCGAGPRRTRPGGSITTLTPSARRADSELQCDGSGEGVARGVGGTWRTIWDQPRSGQRHFGRSGATASARGIGISMVLRRSPARAVAATRIRRKWPTRRYFASGSTRSPATCCSSIRAQIMDDV